MTHKKPPVYDSTLKALFGEEAEEILPHLVPGTEALFHDQNIEIDRSQLWADLVYNIRYKGLAHILNVELQTDTDEEMHLRLLHYHIGLHTKYNRPVISVVVYPFEKEVPESPYIERSADGEVLLLWNYRVIALHQIEVEPFLQAHVLCMYSLFPAMKGATARLLIQALGEMKQHTSPEKMKHHLDRFWKMLQKSITISPEDKAEVEKELKMQFDWFIDTVPEVIERVQQAEQRGETKGEARGEAKGEVQALRRTALQATQVRFPALVTFAEVQVNGITQATQLSQLIIDLMQAPDEAAAMRLLSANTQEV